MLIDKAAADVESAAMQYAHDWRAATGRVLLNRDSVAALLESAFIAGSCHARRLAVVELDDTLQRARARGAL